MKAENEPDKAYQEWFEGLQTVDELFAQLESAEGPENQGQWPGSAADED